MTGRLADLQAAFAGDDTVRFVTLTSDPDYDTPPVLKKFAAQFRADPARWSFLTGNKPELRSLAVNDFKFSVVDKPPADRAVPDDLFIHSTWFALVDRAGQMRGWVDEDGHQHAIFESDDPAALSRLKAAIKQLLREPVT
jgi:cytochrome oxidase Cu insertion factor (SCO1/SenC/PrrC family)